MLLIIVAEQTELVEDDCAKFAPAGMAQAAHARQTVNAFKEEWPEMLWASSVKGDLDEARAKIAAKLAA